MKRTGTGWLIAKDDRRAAVTHDLRRQVTRALAISLAPKLLPNGFTGRIRPLDRTGVELLQEQGLELESGERLRIVSVRALRDGSFRVDTGNLNDKDPIRRRRAEAGRR